MKEYRGILKRIGAKEGDMIVNSNANSAVGHVRVSGTVSVIEIGDVMLRNVGCTRDIYDLLDVGEEAILYVHYHFFRKPVILGVKYPASGRKFTIPFISLFASAVLQIIMYPIFFLIGGLVSTMIIGNFLGMLIVIGGLGLSLYNVVSLVMGYVSIAGK